MLTVRARLALVATVSIASLLALAVLIAVPDWRQQTSLRNDSTTGRLGGQASLPLFVGIQAERTLTAAYLAHPTSARAQALREQRLKTDAGVGSFRTLSGTRLRTDQRHRWEYVVRVYGELEKLPTVRAAADGRSGDADKITDFYTGVITSLIQFYQALSAMDDPALTLETRPLVGLFYASDALARQDMLLVQARAAGVMTAPRRVAFAEAYGTQKVMYERWIAPYLPAGEKTLYDEITSGADWKTVQRAQQQVIGAPSHGGGVDGRDLPAASRWDAAYGRVSQQIAGLNLARTQGLLGDGFARADEIRSHVIWTSAGILAVVVVIAGLLVWLLRAISRRLRQLRQQTEDGARLLPEVVTRLRAGEEVDALVAFPDPGAGDEFGHVQTALAGAQRTAVKVAAAQAADRRGLDAFVAATTDRTLLQVARVLEQLERLMQRPEASELLADLIPVDAAVTVIRRHQDNLATLTSTGQRPPYYEPRRLLDLILDATVETGQPQRVDSSTVRGDVAAAEFRVAPQHVNEIVHALSALMENALGSSADAVVTVSCRIVARGVVVLIEDSGRGMPPEEMDRANQQLATVETSFEEMAARRGRLGHFVIAQLAGRHHMRVELRDSAFGGVMAVVLIRDRAHAQPGSAQGVPAGSPHRAVVPSDRQEIAARPAAAPSRPPVPQPLPAAAPPPGALPVATRDGAAALPRREAGHRLHPASAADRQAPAAPVTPVPASDPAQVADALARFQSGVHAGASHQFEDGTQP